MALGVDLDYHRESEADQTADSWDADRGEFIKMPAKVKLQSAEVERGVICKTSASPINIGDGFADNSLG